MMIRCDCCKEKGQWVDVDTSIELVQDTSGDLSCRKTYACGTCGKEFGAITYDLKSVEGILVEELDCLNRGVFSICEMLSVLDDKLNDIKDAVDH